MTKERAFQLTVPFLLFLVMLFDGQLTNIFIGLAENQYVMTSHLLLFFFMFLSIRCSFTYSWVTALAIGVIYDSYYLGIIGIYALCLPLCVALQAKVFRKTEPIFLTMLLCIIIFVTFIETATFFMQHIFQLINADGIRFVAGVLGPTLVYNVALFLVLYFPTKKILKKFD